VWLLVLALDVAWISSLLISAKEMGRVRVDVISIEVKVVSINSRRGA
jgi:hypothetical protein